MLSMKSIFLLTFLIIAANHAANASNSNSDEELHDFFGKVKNAIYNSWKWIETQAHYSIGKIRRIRHYFIAHRDTPVNIKMADSLISEEYVPPNVPKKDDKSIIDKVPADKPTEKPYLRKVDESISEKIIGSDENKVTSPTTKLELNESKNSLTPVLEHKPIEEPYSSEVDESTPEKIIGSDENKVTSPATKLELDESKNSQVPVLIHKPIEELNSSRAEESTPEQIIGSDENKVISQATNLEIDKSENSSVSVLAHEHTKEPDSKKVEESIPEKIIGSDEINVISQANKLEWDAVKNTPSQEVADNFVKKSSVTSNIYQQQNSVILSMIFLIMIMIIYLFLFSKNKHCCPTIIIGDLQGGSIKTISKK